MRYSHLCIQWRLIETTMDKSHIAHITVPVVLSLLQLVTSYRHFQDLIPNGASVIDPCTGQAAWSGVGHKTREGRTDRNPFGHDFSAHGKLWSKELCLLDSDGDGLTNGQELGDPNCVWTPGQAASGPAKSHPGICEPLSSAACASKNQWLDCNKVNNMEHAVCDSISDKCKYQWLDCNKVNNMEHAVCDSISDKCKYQWLDCNKVNNMEHAVCDSISDKCKYQWLDCNKVNNMEHAVCDSISDKSTTSRDLRLTPTQVPPKETTYYCQLFDLNLPSDLHMVATQPLLNVSDVVHHVLMFGCDPKGNFDQELRTPYPCVMVPHDECRSLIGAWTVGSNGECAHPEMGFRVGPGGYKTVAIQIHWNNPAQKPGIVDNSGLRIHLTSKMRKNDAGMLVVGQQFLQVETKEQGSADLTFSATCPERCTKVMFNTSIYITSAVNHMHYLGKSQTIRVYKNNSHISTITNQDNYNYDSPVINTYTEPIRINPGDELRTTCVYKRTPTPNPVCWGESTSDEMCFGFITYFPVQNLTHPWCTSVNNFPSCDRHFPALGKHPIGDCRWWEFRDPKHPETRDRLKNVFRTCFSAEDKIVCSPECQAVTRKIANHPCMTGDAGNYMVDRLKQDQQGQPILDAIITCSCRDFSYCDRKIPHGDHLLGSRRNEFCTSSPSSASAFWPDFLLYVAMFIILLGQL
ncbi:hypothetical protein BsWGS_08690 [Bradybaena similaris]